MLDVRAAAHGETGQGRVVFYTDVRQRRQGGQAHGREAGFLKDDFGKMGSVAYRKVGADFGVQGIDAAEGAELPD